MQVGTTFARLVTGVMVFAGCAAAHALSISLVPSSATISQGTTQSFDILAADVAPQVISAYDVDVIFDPTYLQYVTGSAVFEQGLGPAFSPFAFGDTPALNSVNLFELSSLSDAALASGPQASSPFTLASLAFLAIAPTPPGAATGLSLRFNALGGSNASNLLSVQPAINPASVTITPRQVTVPEPASALLIGAGLLLLAVFRRRVAR